MSIQALRHDPQRMSARQWLALAIGLVTLAATVGLILDDLAHGAAWTIEHTFGLVLLFCVPAAGLVGRWALAHGERAAGAAFVAAALLGSVLIVYLSTGRQAETRAQATANANSANGARATLVGERSRIDGQIADLKREMARFAQARSPAEVQAALDAVVGSGVGKVPVAVWRRTNNCSAEHISKPESAAACEPVSALRIENGRALEREALRRRLDAAEAQRSAVVAKLEAAGAELVVPSKARAFAEFVGLFGLNPVRIELIASRVDLVLRTLFLEGLTVLAFEFALASVGVSPGTLPAPVSVAALASSSIELQLARDALPLRLPATLRATVAAPVATMRRQLLPATVPKLVPMLCEALVSGCSLGTATVAIAKPATVAVASKAKVAAEADIVALLGGGGQLPSQDVLAQRWGVHKGTASKWISEFERRGLVRRSTIGRAKVVSAA